MPARARGSASTRVSCDYPSQEDGQIDLVTVPRQPGSTLKPFAYALALELRGLPRGARVEWWIHDAPFVESIEKDGRTLWPLIRGRHIAKARVWSSEGSELTWTEAVVFRVK